MYIQFIVRILFSICLLMLLPSISYAVNSEPQASAHTCQSDETGTYYTKFGVLNFFYETNGGKWICYNGKVLIESRRGSNGGYYRLLSDDFYNETLKEDTLSLRKNGELVRYAVQKNGQPVISRMIVKEETGLDADPRYWMLDFRQEEPIVAGPMKARDSSRHSRLYSVIWTDQSVIVILDDDSGPRGGSGSHWTKDAYKYIDKVLLDDDAEDQLSLITKNNRELKEGETITTFDAYVYDYKNKRIIETDIEKEKVVSIKKKKK